MSPPADRPPPPEDVAAGLRFGHTADLQLGEQVAELAAGLAALTETLVAHGAISLQGLEERRHRTRERDQASGRSASLVLIGTTPDKYALGELPVIDCASRVELCKARCCTTLFALSAQDLDERVVRWEYGRPYQIGRRPDGYCVHNDGATRACEVYAERPGPCRMYDCRRDSRIWIDFENRVAAP